MQLEEVKSYLRVDFDADDGYITLLMEAAEEYIINAVGRYRESSALNRLLLLSIIGAMYETRQYTVDSSNERVAYVLKSAILQLQLEEAGDG